MAMIAAKHDLDAAREEITQLRERIEALETKIKNAIFTAEARDITAELQGDDAS